MKLEELQMIDPASSRTMESTKRSSPGEDSEAGFGWQKAWWTRGLIHQYNIPKCSTQQNVIFLQATSHDERGIVQCSPFMLR